jgi:hypothetical protein
MEAINFFNAVQYLEPKCTTCETKIDYGPQTTEWSAKLQSLICRQCKNAIK